MSRTEGEPRSSPNPPDEDMIFSDILFTQENSQHWSNDDYTYDIDDPPGDPLFDLNFSPPTTDHLAPKNYLGLRTSSEPNPVPHLTDYINYFTIDQVFGSKEAVTDWCQKSGRSMRMVIVVTKSDKPLHRRRGRLFLGCERSGIFRDHRKKNTVIDIPAETHMTNKSYKPQSSTTAKCNCPFKLQGVHSDDGTWKLKVINATHGHPLLATLVGHAYANRLKSVEVETVKEM